MDVKFHDISAGSDSNKISISKFMSRRVRLITFALAPTLIVGGVAHALETTNGVLTFEQCMAVVENTCTANNVLEGPAFIEAFRKLSGYGVNGYVCKRAYEESKNQTQNAKTPLQVALWSILLLACGAAGALNLEDWYNKR
jgi:hypothetical protein